MTGKLFINGLDAWTTWGVYLEDGSYENLLAGEEMKPYTTNKSRSEDGVSVSIKNPRLETRSVNVVFCFTNKGAEFLTRYDAFLSVLRAGKVDGTKILPLEIKVPELGKTYRLIYEASSNLSQIGLRIGKVAVKFNEPNPENRTL